MDGARSYTMGIFYCVVVWAFDRVYHSFVKKKNIFRLSLQVFISSKYFVFVIFFISNYTFMSVRTEFIINFRQLNMLWFYYYNIVTYWHWHIIFPLICFTVRFMFPTIRWNRVVSIMSIILLSYLFIVWGCSEARVYACSLPRRCRGV